MQKTVTITLTQSCNLSCRYCYENHKSLAYMSLEKACKIIDQEVKKTPINTEMEIDLFGGEPFVKFDVIKGIVEYIQKNYNDRKIMVFLATNGTLIREEQKEWLKDHNHILVCGLSYDGTTEMQDYNRSNSSSMIDLDFFRSTYPQQEVKMTISKKTLNTLCDGVVYLHNLGFNVACNLAYGVDWSQDENKKILERELHKLIQFYLNNKHIKPCSMLDDPISSIACAEKNALRTCGAGWAMVAYDVDGEDAYPCQFFMPLSIGKEKAMECKKIKFPNDVISDDQLDSKCVNCILKSVCQRCYGYNYIENGNIYIQNKNICELTKIIYKARAYFKACLYKDGCYDNCTEIEKKTLLKSIVLIQTKLDV